MWRALRHARSARLVRRFCTREQMHYDVVVVGAGPAGLSAAIRLKQRAERAQTDLSVCVLEKAAEVGGHILSGNVFEPRAMDELLPNWRETAPEGVPASQDRFSLLTASMEVPLPVPPQMRSVGNYVISLSEMTRWMGEQAEEMGVEIYPGFAAKDVVVEGDVVKGVSTNEFGVGKDGRRKENYEAGVEIRGRVCLLAEGARGSVTKGVVERFGLGGGEHQTFALGIKEVWRVREEVHWDGRVLHTIGFPLDWETYGGGFLYHMGEGRVALGFVTALDYRNVYLSPFEEFQRWKNHPAIRRVLEGGECLQYGARTLNEGGWQSIPKLEFPGGGIIGCAAGFLNVPKIKGTHTAQKSGMVAADVAFDNLQRGVESLEGYEEKVRASWVGEELKRVRNIRPGFKWGLGIGLINAAWETYVTRGRSPWTLKHGEPDHLALRPVEKCKPLQYEKPDGVVTFDILSSVALSGTNHDYDEPCHLVLKDQNVPTQVNLNKFAGPEARYCPAKVYEFVEGENGVALQINAQNCLHCKACDVKDPTQNIQWTVPQGGGGPKYTIT